MGTCSHWLPGKIRNSYGKVDRANSQQWTASGWKNDEADDDDVDIDSDVNCVDVVVDLRLSAVQNDSEPFLGVVTRFANEDVRGVGDTVVVAATITATIITSPVGGASIESRQSIDTVSGDGSVQSASVSRIR